MKRFIFIREPCCYRQLPLLAVRKPSQYNLVLEIIMGLFFQEILHDDDEEYIITGFKVILFIDGPSSEGYIMDGGVLQVSNNNNKNNKNLCCFLGLKKPHVTNCNAYKISVTR